MATTFYLFGSRSSQFEQNKESQNPLPECPGTPNCVRITRHLEVTPEQSIAIARQVLNRMNASDTSFDKQDKNIHSVFQVFLFKDDMDIKVQEAEPGTSYLHIRSASRTGRSDLGVNRRRVKKFLELFYEELQ
ncbi:MAG: DUF1499 domain-containing protein [Balneolaceae bacterium]|nr:DUF1499 domain-containing protein [Balneolaceae bacterium]